MPLLIKMADGTTKEVTLRPTIDVDTDYCPATCKARTKTLRKRIRISHALTRQMWVYRALQWNIIKTGNKCSMKEAKVLSEDPDPYEKTYVFYCLLV